MDRHTRCAYSVIDVCDSSFDPLFHFSPSLSLSLSFSREPIGNYAEQSKTEREKREEEESMQLRGLVLLHEYPIMTDYRGINSLFNQQTTYPACRLSNKIWRPWPRAPNDSLPPFSLVFARSSTRLPIARSLHFARGPFLTAAWPSIIPFSNLILFFFSFLFLLSSFLGFDFETVIVFFYGDGHLVAEKRGAVLLPFALCPPSLVR